ncbi:MAG TPA: glycosyltransferase [Propionibacteriaceae bacterium]|nr:glycosyltransferase [Propionibacteriaceae bacterium]
MRPDGRVGYVLKMYPRFSETFILTELLQLQSLGVDVEIFSLRPPTDGRFHASVSELRAPVSYPRYAGMRAADAWDTLRQATADLGDLGPHLPELLEVDVRDAVQAVEVARACRQRSITHLHAHFASVAATVARLAARIAGITYTVTAHAKDIYHEAVDPEQLRRTVREAAAVITVSDFNLRYLRQLLGADAEGVRRIYNGIDVSTFRFRDPTERPPVIAAVGRLVPKKGFDDLIAAAALLRDAGRRFRIDLVGAGELQHQLAEQIRTLELNSQVRMLGGLPQRDVAQVVGEAAAFAAPCVVGADGNRDGLPTVLLEAMALGTPCVATPVTGIPEVVVDEVTGLLVPERDPVALAEALDRLLDDASLRASLAKAARDLVVAEFDTVRQARLVASTFPGIGPVGGAGGKE